MMTLTLCITTIISNQRTVLVQNQLNNLLSLSCRSLEEQFNSRIHELQFLNRQLTLPYKMFLKSYLQSQCTVSFVFNFDNSTHFPSDLEQFQAPFILNLSKAVSYVCNKNETTCTQWAFRLGIYLIFKRCCKILYTEKLCKSFYR